MRRSRFGRLKLDDGEQPMILYLRQQTDSGGIYSVTPREGEALGEAVRTAVFTDFEGVTDYSFRPRSKREFKGYSFHEWLPPLSSLADFAVAAAILSEKHDKILDQLATQG